MSRKAPNRSPEQPLAFTKNSAGDHCVQIEEMFTGPSSPEGSNGEFAL